MRYIFVSLITIYAPFIQSETLKKKQTNIVLVKLNINFINKYLYSIPASAFANFTKCQVPNYSRMLITDHPA